MKDMAKAAMKAALKDMGITLDQFDSLEFSVKRASEIQCDDLIIRKEESTTIKIEE